MKEYRTIFERGDHKWTVLHKDNSKPEHLIGTNEYLVQYNDKYLLTDPGGTEVFPQIISAVAELADLTEVDRVFCSHQDPDIFSAVALWLRMKPNLRVLLPKIWVGFMMHFGGDIATYEAIPDEGTQVDLGGLVLQALSAHFMHSSGNFHLYDPVAKLLFSGDTGAALIPQGYCDVFVSDFDKHIKHMEAFHRRWFGSNEHKNQWCEKVAKLDLDFLCPQHGCLFQGPLVKKFLDWLYELKVGQINYG